MNRFPSRENKKLKFFGQQRNLLTAFYGQIKFYADGIILVSHKADALWPLINPNSLKFLTREQFVTVLYRFAKLLGKA